MCRKQLLIVLILGSPITAFADTNTPWPCFHGPQRNNLSNETGLLQVWPQSGPRLLWTAAGIGHGYSSVAIAADIIFTAGMIDKQTHVTALDPTGKIIWQRVNGQSWEASARQPWAVPYAGSRATPTVDNETVYHLSELGRLAAFDVRTGKERWHADILQSFRAERPEYGYSESVLIHGNALFCCPGGDAGYVAALDKATGQTLWANTDIKDAVGNCSPVVARIDGLDQLITVSAERVLAFGLEDGRLLWDYAFANKRQNNVADVIVSDGLVCASSGYGKGSVLLRPRRRSDAGFSVESVWTSNLLDNHHGGVLLFDGHLYGAGHEARGWSCLDFKTGRQLWLADGKGSLTCADGRLYCLDEKGKISLVTATSRKWDEISSFRPPRGGRGLYWAHPVVCGGRLYVRHSEQLFAYDIRKY
jgi:outer membrane protein assembly factor BamB